jgi:hypothetical protein
MTKAGIAGRLRGIAKGRAIRIGMCGVRLLLASATAVATLAHADTYVVVNTADAGTGSLRQAMLDANAKQVTGSTACARHSIVFSIPGSGPHTIQPHSPLPKINIPITFDGYSQPGASANTSTQGSNAVIAIELDGSLAGNTDAFVVGAAIPGSMLCAGNTSSFRGFVINRFAGAAISMALSQIVWLTSTDLAQEAP